MAVSIHSTGTQTHEGVRYLFNYIDQEESNKDKNLCKRQISQRCWQLVMVKVELEKLMNLVIARMDKPAAIPISPLASCG